MELHFQLIWGQDPLNIYRMPPEETFLLPIPYIYIHVLGKTQNGDPPPPLVIKEVGDLPDMGLISINSKVIQVSPGMVTTRMLVISGILSHIGILKNKR